MHGPLGNVTARSRFPQARYKLAAATGVNSINRRLLQKKSISVRLDVEDGLADLLRLILDVVLQKHDAAIGWAALPFGA